MASVLALLGKRVRCSCGNSFNTSISSPYGLQMYASVGSCADASTCAEKYMYALPPWNRHPGAHSVLATPRNGMLAAAAAAAAAHSAPVATMPVATVSQWTNVTAAAAVLLMNASSWAEKYCTLTCARCPRGTVYLNYTYYINILEDAYGC